MDLASIGAAYTGLKFAKDALQVVLASKIEAETRTRITDALEKLGATQDTLFELREELFRLQAETERLRQDLRVRDDWDARAARYTLQQTAGGAIVHESTFEPRHFACPACFEKRAVGILQDSGFSTGIYACPSCKSEYRIRRPKYPPD